MLMVGTVRREKTPSRRFAGAGVVRKGERRPKKEVRNASIKLPKRMKAWDHNIGARIPV
jgi:hypothetical protein